MDLDPVNGKNSSNATNLQQQQSNKPTRDDSLVAPAPASQSKLKTQAFKKKTKQVFIASDQLARMLKREEYQSWLLEDSSTGVAVVLSELPLPPLLDHQRYLPTRLQTTWSFVLIRMGKTLQSYPVIGSTSSPTSPNYDTLGPEEAEAAYEKMQKPTTKEDVGRWFMRRRGAAAGSNSMNPINQ
ncbi:hypothetical protein PPACK8108_LOCUS23446 [Phakopsora pachyrhizi]|uniref:Uncharacterized protein n=1 Tax=Phakopsora pachyrhizi TaxID=170000 RepID=A0AAV0BR01_PHAPC|nr:hypothetical protein PPACK8108_LOCUS23446 [Phakopsora pachyrhizi]